MDRQLYEQAKGILLGALSHSGRTREDFVERECADRPELLREVRSLLAHHEQSAPLVDEGIVRLNRRMPPHIGPYEVVEMIGEGGMGIVYRGRQSTPIKRDVAIKVLHAGLNTARILERFAWERRSLARMNHPNIARILDAGADTDGHPYVVLELIDGLPVTTWCSERQGEIAQRIDLMGKVCQAVQHAHDRGVLHRDLKPGNVLVREIDGEPTPCIIDFGIAKALDDTHTGEQSADLTVEGQQIGTPAYMSPEQLAGRTSEVDVRTDVYALGVILYELLAGRRPFSDDHLQTSRQRDEPPAPSQVSGRRELRGDLDRICLMAIRPEADRRYRSATDLAADLARFTAGRPVLASPDTWRYRAGKLVRRHPVQTTLAVALLTFTIGAIGFLGFHNRRLNTERDRALAAEQLARREASAATEIATFMENLFVDMDPIGDGSAPTTAVALLDSGATRLETELPDQPANRGRLWAVIGRVNQNIARHELAEIQLRNAIASYAEVADSNSTLAARAELRWLLAICLHDQGQYARSEAAFRRALMVHRRAYPIADVTQVQITTDLATAIQAQGRLLEALNMMDEAIALAQTLGPDGEPEVAYIRNIRGYILFKRGAYADALRDMEAALVVNRRLYPGDDMALVSSLNNVGGMNLELGRYPAAKALINESRDMLERIFQGSPHPAITRANVHLARIALETGDTTGAEAGFEAAYDQSLRQLGPAHPITWRTMQGLATVRLAQGRLAEAQELLQSALANLEEHLGPTNAKTLASRVQLGHLVLTAGDPAAARAEFETVVTAYETEFAPGHPRLYAARVNLAEALLAQGFENEARTLLQKAVPELERVYGSDYAMCRHARELLWRAG